jgi:NAD(P)H-hydrate epimerase
MNQSIEIPDVSIHQQECLSIDNFKQMDKLAVEQYGLPIELMMENAGLQLARLVVHLLPKNTSQILIGIGTGNNGGGGLVAARRLAGWGYDVFLDIPVRELKELPSIQLKRVLSFGVKNSPIKNPDLFVDAYLGFSQRLPLSSDYKQSVRKANAFRCIKISLDIPTGFDKETGLSEFNPHAILMLAVPKLELCMPDVSVDLYVADLGIPSKIYDSFNIMQPNFSKSGIIRTARKE